MVHYPCLFRGPEKREASKFKLLKNHVMKKILCPVDFSALTDTTVVYAAKTAKRLGWALTLMNVQSLLKLTPEEALRGEATNVALVSSRLEELSLEVEQIFKITCTSLVATTVGTISNIIAEKANGYDLVIMGTNGSKEIFGILTESHTYKVLRKIETPLLFIPAHAWYSEVRKIAYAFDYRAAGTVPLISIVGFARELGSSITVLQIVDEIFTHEKEKEMKIIQERVTRQYQNDNIHFEVVYDSDTVDGINNYLNNGKADVLAVYSSQLPFLEKLFHKSVIKKLSEAPAIPVLVIHA